MVPAPGPLLDATLARTLLARAWPVLGHEAVAVADAAGRMLAAAVVSPEDLPAVARSAMDGYAVPAIATRGASATSPIALPLGETIWPIATGGPVPDTADAVVMIEQTASRADVRGSEILVHAEVEPGRNVIARGDHVHSGAVLAPAGHRLSPRDLALLAAVGIAQVDVERPARVAVISSGAELIPPGQGVPTGRVRDVNQLALCAAVRSTGALALAAGIVPDDPGAIAAALSSLAPAHDLILMTGGTSIGVADHTAAALVAAGARPLFHGLAIRPGRPTLAAVLGSCLVVGLPGVPTAAAIVFEIFVRPLLQPGQDRGVPARLTTAVTSAAGREDHVRVSLESRSDGFWATPVGGGPSSLRALATAAGVAIVPADAAALAAGACITVMRF